MNKKNINNPSYIVSWVLRIANMLGIITVIFLSGSWTQEVEGKSFDSMEQKRKVIEHIAREDIHKSVEDEESHFVTRREYELNTLWIKETLTEMKETLIEINKSKK